jgi:hypothetical protein
LKNGNRIGSGVLAFVLAFGPCAVALGEEGGEKVTVQGEVLDLACWVAHGQQGAEHVKCAQACAKSGQPIGLLASDGTVYLLYASHQDASAFQQAKEHAGHKVEVTGLAATKGGIRGLEVSAVKAL